MSDRKEPPRIWCFGDSNTYGYDPCVWYGGRYAAPWPELLAKATGFPVINDGENGRRIPRSERELLWFRKDAETYRADVLIPLLGGNDLLNGVSPDEVAARMETLLRLRVTPNTLLIGPPPLARGAWVPDDQLVSDSVELSRQYRMLARRLGIWYADAAEWNVELTYDGVHFTEQGHAGFAKGLATALSGFLRPISNG